MSLPDRSEAWEESLDPRLGSWYNPASWGITKDIGKDFKDVATGNFGQLGKDVGKTISEGVKDIKGINKTVDNAAKSTWNFAKDHAGEIALGVGMGALALTGVGLIADAGIGAGLAADVAATTVAETAGAGAAAAETAGAAAAADTAGAAAADTAATAAEDTAASSSGRIQLLKDKITNSAPAQKVKDIYDTKAVQTVKNVATNPAVDIAASTAYTQNNMPTMPEIPTPPAPPPAPTSYAAAPVDTSNSATGQAVTGPAYTGTGAALNISQGTTGAKQDKILDLVEQFGLHPNDIKASLTSWQ